MFMVIKYVADICTILSYSYHEQEIKYKFKGSKDKYLANVVRYVSFTQT